uniref:Uncharacterized protein n=1 Tax=Arundo donax TaxID=35708 RepID=A0A0A9GD47_ARUDO
MDEDWLALKDLESWKNGAQGSLKSLALGADDLLYDLQNNGEVVKYESRTWSSE